jgi:hypothetical protein
MSHGCEHWRLRFGWPNVIEIRTRNELKIERTVEYRNTCHVFPAEFLIHRRHHLLRCWKIHPELDELEFAACLLNFSRRTLAVDDATTTRNPLYFASMDCALVTKGIAMQHASLVYEGYRFESTVWVWINTMHGPTRFKRLRSCVVQQDKRIDIP